jgi:hypothetical protein
VGSWTLYPAQYGLGDYHTSWDQLNAALYDAHPYFDSKFINCLLKYFATAQVILCVHRTQNVIDGLLLVAPKGAAKWSVFTPAQTQITPLLLKNPADLLTLPQALPGLVLALDVLCQDPDYSPLQHTLSAWQSAPVRHALTINIATRDGSFDDYLAARSSKFRSNLQRRFYKVQQAGITLSLRQITEPAAMQAAICQFGELESSGWKHQAGTAVHINNVQGSFYLELLENFAQSHQACVYQLYFDEQPVAMELCLTSANMLILLKTAHNESLSCYAPGRLLLYLILQQEFALQRVNSIEFYTNADMNEQAWAKAVRWINHHMLLRNKLVRYCYQLLKG